MNKRILFISTIILGLTMFSCKPSGQRTEKSGEATATTPDKEQADVKGSPNTRAMIYAKEEVPVLCYHRIDDGRKGDYTVSRATFAAHMKILADSGYHAVLPDQLYDYLVYNKALPNKPVMITFDDSRVEHAAIAAPILEKHGFRGVFFIMTITYDKKNYMTKEQITQLAKAGHVIGLHSWDHTMVIKYKDAADWKKQVTDPKKKLETIVGKPVEYWAYPNGVYDHKGAMELSKNFKISFTLFSKRDSIVPLQTVRRILGTECTPQRLLKSMRQTFSKHKA